MCLQEVTPNTLDPWRARLAELGLTHSAAGDTAAATAEGRSRPLLVLSAAREPLSVESVPGLPWPERVVAARTGALLTINVHSPISPKPGLVKVRTHEALHAWIAGIGGATIVCGDLNTPRKEHADGRVWTFARDRYGRLRPERGERWDRAELALIRGLEPYGFADAFRLLRGPAARELSWEWPRWGGGYRLDHLIASAQARVRTIEYQHEWRRAGLSDHSALLADLQLDV